MLKRETKNKNRRRAFAAFLISSMIFTSNGFQTLAAEASQMAAEAMTPEEKTETASPEGQAAEMKEESAPQASPSAAPEAAVSPAAGTETIQTPQVSPTEAPAPTVPPALQAEISATPEPGTDGEAAVSPAPAEEETPAPEAEQSVLPVTPVPQETSAPEGETAESAPSKDAPEVSPSPQAEVTGTPEVVTPPEETPAPEELQEEEPETSGEETSAQPETPAGEETKAPKTEFIYEDSRVIVRAVAQESANLPETAELRADYIAPGTVKYQEFAAIIEAQLSVRLQADREDTQVEYVLYDVYFLLPDGSRIEPESGNVKVEMTFRQLQATEAEGEIVNKDVVHIKENGQAEVVTDYVHTNEKGEVTSMGFTQDSFYVTGAALTIENTLEEQPETVESITADKDMLDDQVLESWQSDQLAMFVKKVEVFVNGEKYDGSTTVPMVQKFRFEISFDERMNKDKRLAKTVTYQLPKDYLVNWTESGDLTSLGDDSTVVGRYVVNEAGLVTITFTDEFYAKADTGLINGVFYFESQLETTPEKKTVTFRLPGMTTVLTVNFDTRVTVATDKTYTFDPASGVFTFTITGTAHNGTAKGVEITDQLGSQLELCDGGKYQLTFTPEKAGAPSEGTVSGNSFRVGIGELVDGQSVEMTYKAKLTAEAYEAFQNGTRLDDAKNCAKVTTEDPENHVNEVVVDAGKEYRDYPWLDKNDGAFDAVNNVITWLVTYNKPETGTPWFPVQGYTVKDELDPALNGKVSFDTENDQIKVTRSDGSNEEVFYVPFTDARTWSYEIGSASSDAYNTDPPVPYSYTFEYSAKVDEGWKDSLVGPFTVKNRVWDERGHADSGEMPRPGLDSVLVEKHVTAVTNTYMEWSASFNVPAKGGNYWATDQTYVSPVFGGKTYWNTCLKVIEVSARGEASETNKFDLSCEAQYNKEENRYYFYFDNLPDKTSLVGNGGFYKVTVTYKTSYDRADGESWPNNGSLPVGAKVENTVTFATLKAKAWAAVPGDVTFEKCYDRTPPSPDYSNSYQNKELPFSVDGERYRYYIKLDPDRGGINEVSVTDTHSPRLELMRDRVYLEWNPLGDPKGFYGYGNGGRCWVNENDIIVNEEKSSFTVNLKNYIPAPGMRVPCAYRLYYVLKVKDKKNFTGPNGEELQNQAVIDYNNEKSDPINAPAVTYVNLPLKKTLTNGMPNEKNGYKAGFQISVTAQKGLIDDQGQLKIEDTCKNLDMLLDTLQVKKKNGPSWETIDFLLIPRGKGADIVIQNAEENADYVITYDAVMKGRWNSDVTFSNTANIPGKEGYYNIIKNTVHKVQTSGGGATATTYQVKVFKYDSRNAAIKLDGAKFSLYKVNGVCDHSELRAENDPDDYCLKNDESFDKLVSLAGRDAFMPNEQYYLIETTAPDGYIITSDPIYFYFDEPAEETTGSEPGNKTALLGTGMSTAPYTLYVPNDPKGFSVLKTDAVKGIPLSGAAFTLYLDPACQIEARRSVGGADGVCDFGPLENGDYYLKETSAPTGYILLETVYKVTALNGVYSVVGDGQVITGTSQVDKTQFTIGNVAEATATIQAVKVLQDEKLTGRKLKDGEFQFVLAKKSAVHLDGTAMTDKEYPFEPQIVGNQGGKVTFSPLKYNQLGTYIYTLKESAENPIEGVDYDKSEYTVIVEVKMNSEKTAVTAEVQYQKGQDTSSKEPVKFVNKYLPEDATAKIKGAKSLTGRALKNGEFSFKLEAKPEGGQQVPMPAVPVVKNGADGSFAFGSITYTKTGTYRYIVSEVVNIGDTAAAYDTTEHLITVEVTDNGLGALTAKVTYPGGKTQAEFVNKNRSVSIAKTDMAGTQKLPGAHLQIVSSAGAVVKEWDSTAEAQLVTGLLPGVYTLKETSAPAGYAVAAETKFELKEDGTVNAMTTPADQSGVLLVKDKKTSASVRKIDAADGRVLIGARLQILDGKGTVVADWVSAAEDFTVEGLQTETAYTLHEVTAPAGYALAADTVFQLKKDGTVDAEKSTAVSENGVLLVEDRFIQTEDTSITVAKTMTFNGMPLVAEGISFYTALYYDKECTRLASPVREIQMGGIATKEVTFNNLEVGRSYYVGECDSSGKVLYGGEIEGVTTYQARFTSANGNYVKTKKGKNARVDLENRLDEMPDGYYIEGQLHVTKKMLGTDGAPMAANEVFYAGIFDDPEYTVLSSSVDRNILELNLDGKSKVEAVARVMLPDKDAAVVLYVTEVDASGKPAADAPDFAYDVSVDGESAVLEAESLDAYTTITNKARVIEETEETEETEEAVPTPTPQEEKYAEGKTETPKTGDESPVLPMAGALGASVLAILFLLNGKRRRSPKGTRNN